MKEQSSDSQNSGNLKMEVQDMTENFREIIGLLKGFGVQKYFILKQIKSFLKEFMGAKSTIDILNTYAVLGAENQKKLLSFINMILKDEYGKVNVPCVIKFGEDVF